MPDVSPLDLLRPSSPKVSADIAESRFSICRECPDIIPRINVCKHCGCVMKLKTTLAEATCPVGKW